MSRYTLQIAYVWRQITLDKACWIANILAHTDRGELSPEKAEILHSAHILVGEDYNLSAEKQKDEAEWIEGNIYDKRIERKQL